MCGRILASVTFYLLCRKIKDANNIDVVAMEIYSFKNPNITTIYFV